MGNNESFQGEPQGGLIGQDGLEKLKVENSERTMSAFSL